MNILDSFLALILDVSPWLLFAYGSHLLLRTPGKAPKWMRISSILMVCFTGIMLIPLCVFSIKKGQGLGYPWGLLFGNPWIYQLKSFAYIIFFLSFIAYAIHRKKLRQRLMELEMIRADQKAQRP